MPEYEQTGPARLAAHQDGVTTGMGGWVPGERVVFRGFDLHRDLGELDWMALYVFGITGRRYTGAALCLLNAMWSYTSFPDPRLWNNRVAAVAASARSTAMLGISAAIATSEATLYGGRPVVRSIDFLIRTQQQVKQGGDLAALVAAEVQHSRGIFGYGRPVTKVDERIPHLMALARKEGYADGAHVKLAFAIERLAQRWRLNMNYAGLIGALGADLGFSAREFYLFNTLVFVAGMFPCVIDAANKPEGTFLPLACEQIKYEGPRQRFWAA